MIASGRTPRRWIFAINLVRDLKHPAKPLTKPFHPAGRGRWAAAREIATKAAEGVLALTFPDDCRICGVRLMGFPPCPFCTSCLAPPEPLSAETFCVQCHAPFLSESALDMDGRCRLCRTGLTHFDALYCVGAYEGRLRELIHHFKYTPMERLGKPLGVFLRSGLPREMIFDCLTAMPLHRKRQRERGFNQAELLAREVAKVSAIPVVALVERARHTDRQAGLTGKQRRLNVRNAFRVKDPTRVKGQRILIVDDVVTTGASANACASALKQAGASFVAILALARADRRIGAGPEAAMALRQFV